MKGFNPFLLSLVFFPIYWRNSQAASEIFQKTVLRWWNSNKINVSLIFNDWTLLSCAVIIYERGKSCGHCLPRNHIRYYSMSSNFQSTVSKGIVQHKRQIRLVEYLNEKAISIRKLKSWLRHRIFFKHINAKNARSFRLFATVRYDM